MSRVEARELVRPRSLVSDVAGLCDGSLDPRGYVIDLCNRIEECEPAVHAFVPETNRRSRLLDCVPSADPATVDTPRLRGVLVGVKDVIRVDGFPTRAGSRLPPELLDGPQAAVVDRLLAAGAQVAGKTVTAEFAVMAPGATTNPHDTARTPGGSSSGSAAAVAAGMVPLAIGTQTLGSVIRPAAFCGIVGFRPSWGTIPSTGVIANAPTLDTVGLFTADVPSATLAAQVLCGWGSFRIQARPPVLGVPAGPYLNQASPLARASFEAQLAGLAAAGITLRAAPLVDDLDAFTESLLVINRYELAQVHTTWFAAHPSRYRQVTATAIQHGMTISPAEYAHALRWRTGYISGLTSTMDKYGIDAWITPAATGPAPLGLSTTGDPAMSAPFSLAGMPAITLPAPSTHTRLPLGLQLAARPGADQLLLAQAALVETALQTG